MQHFTAVIKTSDGDLNFYFNRLFTAFGVRYHVSAVGKNRKAIIANMEMTDEGWKFVDSANCPQWFVKVEKELSNAISASIFKSKT